MAVSSAEEPIRWLKSSEALLLLAQKAARVECAYCGLTASHTSLCTKSPNGNHWLFAQLYRPREKDGRRSPCTLTWTDMEQNAEAVADHKDNAARTKVDAWPEIHDTRAVTIVAGRGAYIPPQGATCDALIGVSGG